jgi:hypothetical protein
MLLTCYSKKKIVDSKWNAVRLAINFGRLVALSELSLKG